VRDAACPLSTRGRGSQRDPGATCWSMWSIDPRDVPSGRDDSARESLLQVVFTRGTLEQPAMTCQARPQGWRPCRPFLCVTHIPAVSVCVCVCVCVRERERERERQRESERERQTERDRQRERARARTLLCAHACSLCRESLTAPPLQTERSLVSCHRAQSSWRTPASRCARAPLPHTWPLLLASHV
jgi:hypothetical protein